VRSEWEEPRRFLRRIAGLGSGFLLLAAAVSFGHGAWIYAKASLAQILLRRAWSRTVHSGRPAPPWPWADTWPIARLRAPGLSGDVIVLAGSSGRTLAFGPGHIDGTASPGEPGNCVLSAHRDTQFAFLKSLIVGDLLELETADGHRHSYRVYDRRIAHEKQLDLLESTADPTLTLVTCYPFDAIRPGGPLRYVVRAVAPGPSF
jgi:sortase A